jgi:coproporphyrinogen III oxidase
MANPHVPAVHMNTRFLCTARRWFGGGADLNPAIPYAEDTAELPRRAARPPATRTARPITNASSKWCEEYFWLPHRKVARGVGGIFYDRLEGDFDANFAFTRDVGEAFLAAFPPIVRRRWTALHEADMDRLLEFRGRYAEFNLLYDRGTIFGLKTGGNVDAILMSLPPLAKWRRLRHCPQAGGSGRLEDRTRAAPSAPARWPRSLLRRRGRRLGFVPRLTDRQLHLTHPTNWFMRARLSRPLAPCHFSWLGKEHAQSTASNGGSATASSL